MIINQEPHKEALGQALRRPPTQIPTQTKIAASDAPSALPTSSKRDFWEEGERYPGVIFHISETPWRVSVCPQGRQWVLQRKCGHRWQSLKFFATKRRLAEVIKKLCGDAAYSAVAAKVKALPI